MTQSARCRKKPKQQIATTLSSTPTMAKKLDLDDFLFKLNSLGDLIFEIFVWHSLIFPSNWNWSDEVFQPLTARMKFSFLIQTSTDTK